MPQTPNKRADTASSLGLMLPYTCIGGTCLTAAPLYWHMPLLLYNHLSLWLGGEVNGILLKWHSCHAVNKPIESSGKRGSWYTPLPLSTLLLWHTWVNWVLPDPAEPEAPTLSLIWHCNEWLHFQVSRRQQTLLRHLAVFVYLILGQMYFEFYLLL